MRIARLLMILLGLVLLLLRPAAAAGCFPIAQGLPRLIPASLTLAAIPDGSTVQLTFLGHSSFLIETRQEVTAVTDYNGYIRPAATPLIVTMNNAHETHYTLLPDPAIRHVLRGWNPNGGWAEHDLIERDLRVRNVPTAVHGRYGDQALSNSIFVFEVEDLCIAHLGHLHHLLTREQLAELGQIDIVLAPVDGSYTLAQEEMFEVIDQIRAQLVIPMHYFGPWTLARFTDLAASKGFAVTHAELPTIALSRSTLPQRQVLVLPGR